MPFGLVQLLPYGFRFSGTSREIHWLAPASPVAVKSSLLRTNEGLGRNFGTGDHYQLRKRSPSLTLRQRVSVLL
ncbi:hypothetical protein [Nostoc sp.]|uniref:hypothetical protein n=1 Tax=Nostoc sp. TaxID=1180 RepID=UPI002FF6524A